MVFPGFEVSKRILTMYFCEDSCKFSEYSVSYSFKQRFQRFRLYFLQKFLPQLFSKDGSRNSSANLSEDCFRQICSTNSVKISWESSSTSCFIFFSNASSRIHSDIFTGFFFQKFHQEFYKLPWKLLQNFFLEFSQMLILKSSQRISQFNTVPPKNSSERFPGHLPEILDTFSQKFSRKSRNMN